MVRSWRFWIGLALGSAVLAALLLFVVLRSEFSEKEPERWFIPGPLGHARGYPVSAPSPRAFLTRAMTGVDRTDGGEWSRHNQLTKSLAFSHALARVFPPELYQKHPEFFPLLDGKRLQPPSMGPAFWNPDLGREDVAEFAAAAARKYFEAHPEEESFALGVNDALIWGESPELLALATPTRWFRERPDYSPLVFTFMNRAADELAKTHPQKFLGALAYYFAENVPPFSVRPNVVPFLTADRSQGYDSKFREEELQLQERWAKSGVKRLGMYDYVYGSGFLIPRIHTRLLAENIRHARSVGFTDYYAEVNPNWGLDGPMPWLLAQLLYDPGQPRDQLLAEYYRRYFQDAASPMRQFFEACEKQWISQPGPSYWLKHFRNDSQATVFPAAVCRELRHFLDEATRLNASDVVRDRIRLVREAFGVTERFVALEETRDQVSRVVLKREQNWRTVATELRSYLTARRELIRYAEALRRESPLAIAPFGWDDYLKNDPLAAALFSIRDAADAAGKRAAASAELSSWTEPMVSALWPAILSAKSDVALERNGQFSGSFVPARRIAGLDYSLSLPAVWTSRVEPSQFFQAGMSGSGSPRLLRIAGTKDTMIFQWNPLITRGLQQGSVVLKGHVSPGTSVSVMVGWLDAKERNVGFKSFRLPDGDWRDPVALEVAGLAPEQAVWVGVGLRIQNQVQGDWVEMMDFRLRGK